MPNLKREQELRKEWELMQAQGHARFLIDNVLSWIGIGAIVEAVMFCLDKIGWLHNSPTAILSMVVCWGIAGLIMSEIRWSDMKRKFRAPPPEEDWIVR